jgi:hypothetical protein
MIARDAAGWRAPGTAMSGFAPQPSPPLFDTELGQIFLRMRTLLGVSLWDMARLVGAEPTVIADLEAGALSALPPWPELTRLVDAYAAQTGINAQPIFARLMRTLAGTPHAPAVPQAGAQRTITLQPMGAQAGYSASHAHAAPIPASAFVPLADGPRTVVSTVPTGARRPMPNGRSVLQAPALAANAEIVTTRRGVSQRFKRGANSTWRGLRRALRRRLLGLIVLVGLPVLLVATARLFPVALYGLLAPLPAVVAAPFKMGADQLVGALAPQAEGLTWIDIGDPRLRKADRLPERAR